MAAFPQVAEEHGLIEFEPIPLPPAQLQIPDDEEMHAHKAAAEGSNDDQVPNVALHDQADLRPVVNIQEVEQGALLLQIAEEHHMMELEPVPSPLPQPQIPGDEDMFD